MCVVYSIGVGAWVGGWVGGCVGGWVRGWVGAWCHNIESSSSVNRDAKTCI